MKDEEKPSTAAGVLGGKKKAKKPKGKKGRVKETHIEHHAGKGGHTVRHIHEGGSEATSYTASDLDGVKQGLDEHVGDQQEAEAQPDQASPMMAAAPPAGPSGQA